MQIKRFEAKDMTEALRRIKRELGPEAVILAARDVRRESPLLGISRKVGVAVTAAADNPAPLAAAAAGERGAGPAPLRGAPEGPPGGRPPLADRVQDLVRLGRRADIPALRPQAPTGPAAEAVARLKAQGVRGHLLERLSAAAAEAGTPADAAASLTRCLQGLGLKDGAGPGAPGDRRRMAVVGGPGAGKTTALMKIAAHAQCVSGRATAVATLDTFGLGAGAAWQVFGAVTGVTVAAVGAGSNLKALLESWKAFDLVLVDTPGIGAADEERLAWVESHLAGLRSLDLHLALPADRREEDLRRLHQRLRRLPLGRVLVTRLDEALGLGDLLHHLVNVGLPLSWFSTGQQIPQDLAPATVAALVRRLLDTEAAVPAAAAPVPTDPAGSGPFLANRSSDIFHVPDCRWTAMISPANRVEFATFADALEKRYTPCRYCHPRHVVPDRGGDELPQTRAACGH